jgi:hypothetical protein
MPMFTGAPMENQFDVSHWTGHVISLLAIIGSIAGWLPAVAALAGFIWYAIQIYESQTVKDWVKRRHARAVVRAEIKLAKLRLKISPVAAYPHDEGSTSKPEEKSSPEA